MVDGSIHHAIDLHGAKRRAVGARHDSVHGHGSFRAGVYHEGQILILDPDLGGQMQGIIRNGSLEEQTRAEVFTRGLCSSKSGG